MSDPLTFDIRIWLSASQYTGLLRLAQADDRAVSSYVRRLIQRDLDESVEALAHAAQRPAGSAPGRSLLGSSTEN